MAELRSEPMIAYTHPLRSTEEYWLEWDKPCRFYFLISDFLTSQPGLWQVRSFTNTKKRRLFKGQIWTLPCSPFHDPGSPSGKCPGVPLERMPGCSEADETKPQVLWTGVGNLSSANLNIYDILLRPSKIINITISLLPGVKHLMKVLEGPDPMMSQALYKP